MNEIINEHIEVLREALRHGAPIIISASRIEGIMSTLEDALAEREPVAPSWGNGRPFCGACGRKLIFRGEVYCHNCGRKINW